MNVNNKRRRRKKRQAIEYALFIEGRICQRKRRKKRKK